MDGAASRAETRAKDQSIYSVEQTDLNYARFDNRCQPRIMSRRHASSEWGPARKPPSRTRDWPVMKDARSEHIHTTASAISAGSSQTADGMATENVFVDRRSAKEPIGPSAFRSLQDTPR